MANGSNLKYLFILLFLFIFIKGIRSQDTLIFREINGIVAVEAEHYFALEKTNVRSWYHNLSDSTPNVFPDLDNGHYSSASNDEYIEILPDTRVTDSDQLVSGINFSNTPGKLAIVKYLVQFSTTGRYYVWARAYSSGSEDNSIHVGIDGTWPSSGQRMQWCTGKNSWKWESMQRTEANSCGEPYLIYLDITTTGIHEIAFSMREDGFEFDKWLMTNDQYYIPSIYGPPEVITDIKESCNNKDEELLAVKVFPNPFNSETIITLNSENVNVDFMIYNSIGEKILSVDNYTNSAYYFNGSSLSSGIYFVVIKDNYNGKLISNKIVYLK